MLSMSVYHKNSLPASSANLRFGGHRVAELFAKKLGAQRSNHETAIRVLNPKSGTHSIKYSIKWSRD